MSDVAQLVAEAKAIAGERRHGFVGTEHLLAALLRDEAGFPATMLAKAGIDPVRVRTAVIEGLRAAPEDQSAEPALSRFADRALEQASAKAKQAGRTDPDDRDLLLALLADPRGRIGQVLRSDGKAVGVLREALGEPPRPVKTEPKPTAKTPPKPQAQPKPPERSRRGRGDKSGQAPVQAAAQSEQPEPAPPPRRIARPETPRRFSWTMLLLAAIPVTIWLNWIHASPVAIFVAACIGILPLAELMGEATESLADRTGPTIGGLLNATFGNAAELIIAFVALRAGLVELVKASITGSILGNLLLILGLSCIAAGSRSDIVKFSRTNAGMSAAMLALAVVGLVFPTLFHTLHGPPNATAELYLSEAVAVILIIIYGLSLLFSLKTHRALFGGGDHPAVIPKWGLAASVGILAAATIGIVVQSEILVHVVEGVTKSLGMTETFLGLVIIPLIGNAAEHATAVVVARKGQTDLAFQIALGSSTQVALLIAPLLVFLGLAVGAPMNLVFPPFDVVALAVSTIVIAIITLDGETHWFEGAQLLALYAMMAAAAFFI